MDIACSYAPIVYPLIHRNLCRLCTGSVVPMSIKNENLNLTGPCIKTPQRTQVSATSSISILKSSYASLTSGTNRDISNSVKKINRQDKSVVIKYGHHYSSIPNSNIAETSLFSVTSYNSFSSMTSSMAAV